MTSDFLAAVASELERAAEELAAEEARFGRLVARGPQVSVYERFEGETVVSTMVTPGVAYELVGVRAQDI